MLPLKQSQFYLTHDDPLSSFPVLSDSRWPSLVLSRKIVLHFLFRVSLLQAIDGVMPWLCASQAPKYSGYSENRSTWEGCFACRCINLLGHFPSVRCVQGSTPKGVQYNTIQLYCLCVEKCPFWLVIYIKHSIHFIRHQQFKGVRRWMSTTDTFQSGLLFPCFTFCSKVIESQVDGMCGLTVISWCNPAGGMGDCNCYFLYPLTAWLLQLYIYKHT